MALPVRPPPWPQSMRWGEKNSAAELLKAVEGAAGRTTAATRPEVVTFKKEEKNGETEHLSSAIF